MSQSEPINISGTYTPMHAAKHDIFLTALVITCSGKVVHNASFTSIGQCNCVALPASVYTVFQMHRLTLAHMHM